MSFTPSKNLVLGALIASAMAQLDFFEPFDKPTIDGWKANMDLSSECFEHRDALPTESFILSSGRNMGGLNQYYFETQEIGVKAPETQRQYVMSRNFSEIMPLEGKSTIHMSFILKYDKIDQIFCSLT